MPPLADGERQRLLVRLGRLQDRQLAGRDRHGIGGHAGFVMPVRRQERQQLLQHDAAGLGQQHLAAGLGGDGRRQRRRARARGRAPDRSMIVSSSSGTSRPVSASSRERSPPAIWRWACCRAMTAQRIWAMASQKCTAGASMRRPEACFVAAIEIRPRRDAARLQLFGAEAPASGAEPADIGHGIAPGGELPIENPGEARRVHHVVAAAEILMDQHDLAGGRRRSAPAAQAPFQHRMSPLPAVEMGAQPGDRGQARGCLAAGQGIPDPAAPGRMVWMRASSAPRRSASLARSPPSDLSLTTR